MPKCCRCGGMVDTGDLKSPGSDTVPVRVRSPAPRISYRGVEQLVARRAHNPEVAGSSPVSATIKTTDFMRNRWFFFTFWPFYASNVLNNSASFSCSKSSIVRISRHSFSLAPFYAHFSGTFLRNQLLAD